MLIKEVNDVVIGIEGSKISLTADNYNESALIWCGKMSEQRVSDLLPLDFEPSE